MDNIRYYCLCNNEDTPCWVSDDGIRFSMWYESRTDHDKYFWVEGKCRVRILKKRSIFGDKYELVEQGCTWPIPIFLYRDGEMFYEFFTKQMVGRRTRAVDSVDKKLGRLHIDKQPGVLPISKFEKELYVEECDAATFLKKVQGVIAGASKVGLAEQSIREGIKSIIEETRKNYEKQVKDQNSAREALSRLLK